MITQLVAGVDEVGRGPLAGPVVAAAVILPKDFCLPGLRDSKKMTERARIRCCEVIKEKAIAWSVASASVAEIDEFNILKAAKLAMVRAVQTLHCKPTLVRVDGKDVLDVDYPCQAIIGGDDRHIEISAASVLAKVARDAHMVALGQQYSAYGFERHKGYGTAHHMAALKTHGATVHHRQSFAPVARVIAHKQSQHD